MSSLSDTPAEDMAHDLFGEPAAVPAQRFTARLARPLIAPDELAGIARCLDMPEVRPEWIGANLVIESVPRLTPPPPGDGVAKRRGAAGVRFPSARTARD